MKYTTKLTLALSTAVAVTVPTTGFAPTSISPAIYTVGGTVYADSDADGALDFGEPLLPKIAVSLYRSAEDAEARLDPVRTTTTNALGLYRVSSLTPGTYYAVADAAGAVVAPVSVGGLNLVESADLATSPTATLSATVFADANGNGAQDASESNVDGQTILFIDVAKTIEMVSGGGIEGLDIGSAVSAAVSGSLDIGDAILFRTTAKGAPVTYPDVSAGAYVMMRSPFNLTLGDALTDTARITALIEVISSGDPSALLDDPSLLSASGISTTPDNEYLKKAVTALSKLASTIDRAAVSGLVGEDLAQDAGDVSGTVKQVAALIDAVPAMHFAVVDRRGQGWSLTGLKLEKTNEFLFGVRQPVSITGTVFSDNNANGKKDTFEFAEAVTLTAHAADGTVLSSVKTPSLFGSYTLGKLPYDTDLYIVLSGTTKRPSVPYTGTVPEALAGMTVVASARLDSAGTADTVPLTVGLAR